jgi:hypothetical protein
MTHGGEVIATRLVPNQFEEKLHFGHPLLVGDEDTQPFVSGWFRRLRKTVSSHGPAAGDAFATSGSSFNLQPWHQY